MGKKKIGDFSNKPTPNNGDLFLIQDVSTGTYYNVTKAQLQAIFGGGSLNLQQVTDNGAITTNAISTGGITNTGSFSTQSGSGAEMAISGTDAYMSADAQSNTNIECNPSFNDFLHNVKNQFRAPLHEFDNSVTKNGVEVATETYVNSAIDSAVVGLLDDRGNYDASTNLFPSSGGSGTAGAILKGDLWTISVAGTLGGISVTVGDVVRALVDSPAQTSSNWSVTENNIGYVPENLSNKSSSYTVSSTTTYANTKALVDGLATKQNSLGYTPEDVANKNTGTLSTTSTTSYPSDKTVNDAIINNALLYAMSF